MNCVDCGAAATWYHDCNGHKRQYARVAYSKRQPTQARCECCYHRHVRQSVLKDFDDGTAGLNRITERSIRCKY